MKPYYIYQVADIKGNIIATSELKVGQGAKFNFAGQAQSAGARTAAAMIHANGLSVVKVTGKGKSNREIVLFTTMFGRNK